MTFSFSVETGPLAVREALEQVFEHLAPWSLDVEERGTIELVLAEAMNNIVEHAYPEEDATGQIDVLGTAEPDGLHFELRDYGKPMPNRQAPFGAQADLSVDVTDLPEGGFGWFLIRDLAKDVDYTRDGDVNRLMLRLAIARVS